jgi:hypothetical protein
MNHKGISTLVIAVIVVVVIAVVGVGVYLYMGSSGNGGEATPTPTPSAPDVEGASSLQFSVEVTSEGTSWGINTYMAKNIGTSDMMIRIEMTNGYNATEIVNAAQQKAWSCADGECTDVSDTFEDLWDSWSTTWSGYKNNLADWAGTGEWTYTDTDGNSVRVFDISIDPDLADSLFQPE